MDNCIRAALLNVEANLGCYCCLESIASVLLSLALIADSASPVKATGVLSGTVWLVGQESRILIASDFITFHVWSN